MSGNKTVSAVREYAENAALHLGYELVDIEFVKEGANKILRIYIDKEGGISTDDCERMSKMFEQELDENDLIETAYILEVSSPGLDRQLKKESDFVRFAGRIVDIKLYKSKNGSKKYSGELVELIDGVIKIKDETGVLIEFDKSETASVKLAVIF